MAMPNGSPSHELQFDDDDDGFALPSYDDEPVDLVSLFMMLGEKTRGDCSENRLADPSTSTILCSEPASHDAYEHFKTQNGSLAFPPLKASSSRTFGSSGSSVTESPAFNTNETFAFTNYTNGNRQPLDHYEITDGMFDNSVGNIYQTLEFPDNVESQFMDHNMYSNILCDPSDEFSFPFATSVNEPFDFCSSRWMQSLNQNDDTLFDIKTISEEHLTESLSIKSVMNYEIEVSNTCLASGESSLGKLDKESTSGNHGLQKCNMATTKKLKRNDEQFGHNRNPKTCLQDGGLSVPLLKHQRIALSWMTRKETKSTRCCGGILADDQGLGKTISAIALILKERSPPSSTVVKTKEKQTETLNLDEDEDDDGIGSFIEQKNTSLAGGTLVVCPTSVLRQWNEELQNKVTNESNLSVLVYYGGNRTKDPIEVAKYDVVLTTYAIVSMEVPKQPLVEEDDGQSQTKLSPNKKRKYPPTSDETSNSESINRPLAKLRWFRVILDEAQSIKNYKTQVARACWGLRAKRRWCLSGTPIQNSIDDLYSYFRFLKYDPFSVFKSFCSQIKAPIQRNPVSGYKKLQLILKTIMLRRTKRTLVKGEPIISLPPKTITLQKVDFTDEERGFYRSLEAESRAQFAEYAAAGTVKQNYVNILLMLLRLRQACDHPLLVKESSSNTRRSLSVENAKELSREKLNRLLNCLEASLAICGLCNDPPEDAVVTTCEHVFCNQCILEHLSSDDNQCPSSECKNILTKSSVYCKSTLRVSKDDHPSPSGSLESESFSKFEPIDSSKIKATLQVLKGISGNSPVKEKAIVFSQWTRMLDLLEVCLIDSSIGYRRLDGTMSVVARDKAVKDFNTLPEVSVMIMSLKAASLGLNMVAACHVILLDLWWNPTTEDQAIDRAHRIGQTRPVTVLRFTVKDTVEDRILALQQKKREMVESAFGDDDNGGSQTRLTIEDMRYLFQA